MPEDVGPEQIGPESGLSPQLRKVLVARINRHKDMTPQERSTLFQQIEDNARRVKARRRARGLIREQDASDE